MWVKRRADIDPDDSTREILAPAGSTDPRIQTGTSRGGDVVGPLEDSGLVGVDDAATMIDQPAQSISQTAMQLDTGSLEMVEDGVLSASKAEMMSLIKSQIERQYRRYEMDVAADEVECIAWR